MLGMFFWGEGLYFGLPLPSSLAEGKSNKKKACMYIQIIYFLSSLNPTKRPFCKKNGVFVAACNSHYARFEGLLYGVFT